MMILNTKQIAEKLIKKYNSNNPFVIANHLNIIIIYSDLKNILGFFNVYKRVKFIHLNNHMPEALKTFVCAHELGHAVLHPTLNTPFLRRHTLFSIDKLERQANTFAVELLLPDNLLAEYGDCGLLSIAKSVGIPDKLINLKVG